MSLTSILKNDELIIKLFQTIPDLKPLFKTIGYHSQSFPSYIKPIHHRVINANPAIVGTAYDFYLRAYIQRINNKLIENKFSPVLQRGLNRMKEDKVLNNNDYQKFTEFLHTKWKRRIQYILGEAIPTRIILEDSLYFAYCERYSRSRQKVDNYFQIDLYDLNDLLKLSYATENNSNFFKTSKDILVNPTFGEGSQLVSGADADYIIGNTLFDIKTTNYFQYKQEYINQLIGYYILSKYDDTFPIDIKQLGLYFPRFNKIVYISINDINNIFDIDKFSDYFLQYLLIKKSKRIRKPSLNELILEFTKNAY